MPRPRSPIDGQRLAHEYGPQFREIHHHTNQYMEDPPTVESRLDTANSGEQYQRQSRGASRQRIYVTRGDYVASEGGYEFRPTTTVHDVALIPNYFSSGEENDE
jgi:hypothetical protein